MNRARVISPILLAYSLFGIAPAAELPPDAKVTSTSKEPLATEERGLLIAKSPLRITVPIAPTTQCVQIIAKAGADKSGFSGQFIWSDKSSTPFSARAGGDMPEGQPPLSDSYLLLHGNVRFYIRPDMKYYKPDQRAKVLATWNDLPKASEHLLDIELHRSSQGAQLWIDGRFINEYPQNVALSQLELNLTPGAGVEAIRFSGAEGPSYLPLRMRHFARAGSALPTASTLTAGSGNVEGIPFHIAAPNESMAVSGLGRLSCPSDDLVSFYWSRSTLNALPEARIISVPLDTYSHAHILCAAEDDPAKVPEFTVRLTRYANGRGDGMADTPVRIPKTAAADAKKVASAEITVGGTSKQVPLWLLRVPLRNGLIQDLLREDERKHNGPRLPTPRYLDLEILDPLANVNEDYAFPPPLKPTQRSYVPRGPFSSVQIFGLTLERSTAELTVSTNAPAYAFYKTDNPKLLAQVNAREPGSYTLEWTFADIEGNTAASGRRELTMTAEKSAETVELPVEIGNGWYATRLRLLDAKSGELVDHRGSFVMLPPDTRKAGFDSPHGAWWFHWAHGGEPNIERVGPILQRAGLRHTTLPKTLPESLTGPYGVTAYCVMYKAPTKMTVDEWLTMYEGHIRETVSLYPNIPKIAMLFHESGSYDAPFPTEIWGEKPPAIKPENDAKWQYRMNYVFPFVKMMREKFPDFKIQIGNDGDGTRITAELLRRGLKPDQYDYVAVEDLGQTFIPERPVLGGMQSAWFLRQTARKLGNPEAKINGCYEWLGRRNVALGTQAQAEWYVRDALQARAYGFRTIAIGTVHDAGMGYFHTIWGAGGLCYRYPYMYPKPSYAALATLTRVLDSTVYQQPLPGNSTGVFALEFKRADEWVYALWTARGQREVTATFVSEADFTLTDLYGREKSERGIQASLNVSTSAQYLTSRTRLTAFTVTRASYPDEPKPPATAAVEPLAAITSVTQSEMKHLEQRAGTSFPHRTGGNFDLREVPDSEKGACLELELKPEGQVWELLHEHTVLKLKTPLVAPGACDSVGVWVKGNSGWGDILFEVADSKGASRLLTPDWLGTTAINFDGWCFLRMKLPEGPTWRENVRVLGLVVSMPRQMLYATEFVPVRDLKVRLKDLSIY